MIDPNRPLSSHPTTPATADRVYPTLTGAQIARVAAYGRRRAIARDEVLVDVGDKTVPFFVLVRGELQVVQQPLSSGSPPPSAKAASPSRSFIRSSTSKWRHPCRPNA